MYSPFFNSESTSSSSSWSPSTVIHPASLVNSSTHSPELLGLVGIQISKPVIEYVVDCVYGTAGYALAQSGVIISVGFYARSAKFASFVSAILSRAEVSMSTVLVALVYITRARSHLFLALEEWSLERIFVGAVITASKYTQDMTLKNAHWAMCTKIFGKHDVGRIEREFLEVLDWELGVREADLMMHHETLMRRAWWVFGPAKDAFLSVPRVPQSAVLTHRRHLSAECPALEPSSPHSSVGHASPCTPVSSPSPYPVPFAKPAADLPVPLYIDISSVPVPTKMPCRNLFHSFHIPTQHHPHTVHVELAA